MYFNVLAGKVIQKSLDQHNDRDLLDISNNQSWRLDSSWEFVVAEESEGLRETSAKFPVSNSPSTSYLCEDDEMRMNNRRPILNSLASSRGDHHNNTSGSDSFNDESLNSINNNNLNSIHRFSRYDNLDGGRTEEEQSDDDQLDDKPEVEEKISSPWDSSKWEHLLRIVSESTQQLDNLQMNDDYNEPRSNYEMEKSPSSFGLNIHENMADKLETVRRQSILDQRQRVSFSLIFISVRNVIS